MAMAMAMGFEMGCGGAAEVLRRREGARRGEEARLRAPHAEARCTAPERGDNDAKEQGVAPPRLDGEAEEREENERARQTHPPTKLQRQHEPLPPPIQDGGYLLHAREDEVRVGEGAPRPEGGGGEVEVDGEEAEGRDVEAVPVDDSVLRRDIERGEEPADERVNEDCGLFLRAGRKISRAHLGLGDDDGAHAGDVVHAAERPPDAPTIMMRIAATRRGGLGDLTPHRRLIEDAVLPRDGVDELAEAGEGAGPTSDVPGEEHEHEDGAEKVGDGEQASRTREVEVEKRKGVDPVASEKIGNHSASADRINFEQKTLKQDTLWLR
ncbi:hypothetical protein DFH09DRAFT_1105647 [Mycena vulgaris]|nr:hypothetical protein DFH09DRAFT_1105647 [Mycena vulgaris]